MATVRFPDMVVCRYLAYLSPSRIKKRVASCDGVTAARSTRSRVSWPKSAPSVRNRQSDKVEAGSLR